MPPKNLRAASQKKGSQSASDSKKAAGGGKKGADETVTTPARGYSVKSNNSGGKKRPHTSLKTPAKGHSVKSYKRQKIGPFKRTSKDRVFEDHTEIKSSDVQRLLNNEHLASAIGYPEYTSPYKFKSRFPEHAATVNKAALQERMQLYNRKREGYIQMMAWNLKQDEFMDRASWDEEDYKTAEEEYEPWLVGQQKFEQFLKKEREEEEQRARKEREEEEQKAENARRQKEAKERDRRMWLKKQRDLEAQRKSYALFAALALACFLNLKYSIVSWSTACFFLFPAICLDLAAKEDANGQKYLLPVLVGLSLHVFVFGSMFFEMTRIQYAVFLSVTVLSHLGTVGVLDFLQVSVPNGRFYSRHLPKSSSYAVLLAFFVLQQSFLIRVLGYDYFVILVGISFQLIWVL